LVCAICEGEFEDPVKMKNCEHCFCEECALTNFQINREEAAIQAAYEDVCFVCQKPTEGVYLDAKELAKRVKERLSE
jgi:hypothetical protein